MRTIVILGVVLTVGCGTPRDDPTLIAEDCEGTWVAIVTSPSQYLLEVRYGQTVLGEVEPGMRREFIVESPNVSVRVFREDGRRLRYNTSMYSRKRYECRRPR
jgi:hypothetical protein